MTVSNLPPKQNKIWELVNALQSAAGGGVCKKIQLVAYFDAHGNCVGREEIKITKMYPQTIFDKWMPPVPPDL